MTDFTKTQREAASKLDGPFRGTVGSTMTNFQETPLNLDSYAKFDEAYKNATVVNKDHLRKYPAGLLDGDNPEKSLGEFVQNYFLKAVEKVVTGTIVPTRLGRFSSAAAHFEKHLEARIPVMCKTVTNNPGKSVVSLIPFIYYCPNPSQSEKETLMKRWDDDGDLYKKMSTLSGQRHFIPYIIHGDRGKLLMMCWVMVGRVQT